MNWQIFGITGYLSVALVAAVVALWVMQWKRPRRRLALVALGVALLAMLGARHNSSSHVSRIAVDQSARIAEVKAREKAKREALLKSRNDKVADIQFAEDARDEAIDTAGMDESDLKYLKALNSEDEQVPEWKKQKKTRGTEEQPDDSLEGQLNANEKPTAAQDDAKEVSTKAEPILMDEPLVQLANRLDLWHLRLSGWLCWIAVAVALLDYLRRANMPQLADVPLPLPSSWLDAFTSLPTVSKEPRTLRKDTVSQLVWLTRRGDPWLLFTDDDRHTQEAIKALAPFARKPWNLDLVRIDERLEDSLIFESLWYGRASFICDNPHRAQNIITAIFTGLEQRRRNKAHCNQTVHVIWNWRAPLPDETLEAFRKMAAGSGFTLLVIDESTPQS